MKRSSTSIGWLTTALLLGSLVAGCSEGKTSSNTGDNGGAGGGGQSSGGAAGSPEAGGGAGGNAAGASAGGTATLGCTDEQAALEPKLFEADHAFLRYMGRVDRVTDPKRVKFSAPGVTVKAKFRGSSITVHVHDQYLNSKNYYDVLVDGERIVDPNAGVATYSIKPKINVDAYPMTVSLECGIHTVEVVKRTEASIGSGEFLGFEVAELLEPDPLPERRIEVIGDSITAGAGTEGENNTSICTADSWGQPANNARVTWGAYTAQGVNAQVHISAVSGIGLIRNYSSKYDGRPMPAVYDNLYFEQMDAPVPWDKTKYVPDAILIALGTNDFSPGDDATRPHMEPQTFADAYIAFVDKLHGDYPKAKFFAVSSVMLGDNWPDATYQSRTDQRTALKLVRDHYAGTDTSLTYIEVFPLSGVGCSSHPDATQQKYTADKNVVPVLKEVMGW